MIIALIVPLVAAAQGDVLANNGPWITHIGGGFGGASISVLPTVSGASTMGFGHQVSAGHRIADDFTLTGPAILDRVTLYAFQLNSSTTSTVTAVNLRIWDGPPDDAGSAIVFGDSTTNRMVSTSFTGVYRVSDVAPLNTQRPVMAQEVDLGGTALAPGTYWLDWQTDGSLQFGPHAPPVTVQGAIPIGNARQFDASLGEWVEARDGGLHTQVAIPFVLEGTSSGGCYADCEGDGDTDIFDFLCFQSAYASQTSYADCEGDGDWDVFDFLCFQGAFSSGC